MLTLDTKNFPEEPERDLDRRIRPAGETYRKLVSQWRGMLPAESICLRLG